jgi:hypothetical protein
MYLIANLFVSGFVLDLVNLSKFTAISALRQNQKYLTIKYIFQSHPV